MNSFYKKIALACLVSLTVNQAAHAFQFSDVLDWIKGNQKTSVAIVAGIAALVVLARWMSKPSDMRTVLYVSKAFQPTSYSSRYSDYLVDDVIKVGLNRAQDSADGFAQEFPKMSAALDKLISTHDRNITSYFDKNASMRILTLIEDAKLRNFDVPYNKLHACMVFYEKPSGGVYISDMVANTPDKRKRLMEPLLESSKDLILARDLDRVAISQMVAAFDGVDPEDNGDGVLKRDEARKKMKDAHAKEMQSAGV